MSLIRRMFPAVDRYPVELAEERFATWKAHLDGRKAQGLPGRYPSDEVLAEMALDAVLRERAGAEAASAKKR